MRFLAGLLLLAAVSGIAAERARPLPIFFFPDVFATGHARLPGNSQTRSQSYLAIAPDLRARFSPEGVAFELRDTSLQVRFPGANPSVVVGPDEPLPGRANFFLGGRREDWRTSVPTYSRIRYRELYPKIDLTYSGSGAQIKSEFTVWPGGDWSLIRLRSSGTLAVDSNGDLLSSVGGVALREHAPLIYQIRSSHDRPLSAPEQHIVSGRYKLLDEHTAAFDIGPYDPALPLIIDPVITYSTYLGGSGMGAVTGIAIDAGGNSYVTGWTEALNFPIAGPEQAANAGGVDAFVAKLNPTGTALVYATYIGGNGDDRGAAIAVDSSGQAYVTGSTASTNFPLVSALRTTLGGSKDAFVLKISADGSTLGFSTYLGGTAVDSGTAIAVDSLGNTYVAGDTQSINFPVANAYQNANRGSTDAFITKIAANGAISFSTYLGGSGNEHAGGIAVDASSNVYIAGGTYSADFPILGAIQSTSGGNQDAFVTKLQPGGSQLAYSTYLGGSGATTSEQANAIAVDSSGNAYVAGVTNSSNFPVTGGSYQAIYNGSQDAFAAKINAAGNGLMYSTYLGGTAFDWANGIAVDSNGNAYVAGYTSSFDFPTGNGLQAGFAGNYDAFVTKLSPTGASGAFSTYYGGTGSDVANAIAVDSTGNMFVGGQTGSLDFPLQGPIQNSNNGGSIGWVARLGVTAPPPQTPGVVSVSPSSGTGNSITFTARYSDTGGGIALTTVALLVNTSASTSYACYVAYTPGNNQFLVYNDVPSAGFQTVLAGGGTGQNSQCMLSGTGSSASVQGNGLTVTYNLTFLPGFAGVKSVYLYAADPGSNTGWVSTGSWTVTIPPPQPSADSVSPNAASGASQTFSLVYSDTQNAANLTGLAVLFQSSITATNACYVVYDRIKGTVALVWDSGAGSDAKPIGSTAILKNSQCSLGAASAQVSGLSIILNVSITFKAAFAGSKNIYMYAAENSLNTGWVQRGTFLVLVSNGPVANSVVPGSGSGTGARFSFTISDSGGANYLTGLSALFASTLSTTNACNIVYDRTANTLSLAYDNPANGATPVVPGSSTIARNSQCSLNGANSTVVINATSLVVTIDLTFNGSWAGLKSIYLFASEGSTNSGWATVGSWSVTGGAPTADSVSPSSGAGSSPSFTFTVSDSSSQANITGMGMLLTTGAPTNVTNACYLVYNRTNATIGLYDDTATVLSTKPIGSSATLQNSQCAVGYTVMTTSGNSVNFSVNLLLKTATFSGSKTVYLQANEATTNSGWVARGTWTVQ